MNQGVGEWVIEGSELSFHKRIGGDNGGGGEGVIHAGRWHGDVHIHTFGSDTFDLNEVRMHCKGQCFFGFMGRPLQDQRDVVLVLYHLL